MKANKTMRGQAVLNDKRRKHKESESNIDSAAHNQNLIQQKELNSRNHHILTNINTECQKTHVPHQKTPFGKRLKLKIQQSVVYRRPTSLTGTSNGLG
jgi:hypothetical protein